MNMPVSSEEVFETVIGSMVATTPTFHTHREFVDWLRLKNEDGQLANFLAQRNDCAGATPNQWSMLAHLGNDERFREVPSEKRRELTIGIIGQKAFTAYLNWLVPSV